MEVTVCIGTFGDDSWVDLARDRAIPSAEALGVPVVHVHADTLAEARNQAVERASTEWVVHLDADDELERGYVDGLARGTADVRAPMVRCVRDGRMVRRGLFMPRVWRHRHDCTADCLTAGSWVVVGAAVRRDMVIAVGGWEEWPIYEDWALWLRCLAAGATFEASRDAVYRQHLRVDSRNHSGEAWERRDWWHHEILRTILPHACASA